MNKVILTGRLTKDPELRFAAGTGKGVTRFTIAIPKRMKREATNFINCVAFGKRAETIAQYFAKGQMISVCGELSTGSYEKDGQTRYTTDVLIEEFTFCNGKGGSEGYSNSGNHNQQNNSNNFENSDEDFGDMTPVDDGDMPF